MTYCNKGIRYNSIITIGHLGDVHVLQSSPVCFLVLFINFFYEFETILVLIFFIGRVLLIVKIVKEKSEHGPVVLFSRETSTKIKNLRIPWPVDQKFKCWGGGLYCNEDGLILLEHEVGTLKIMMNKWRCTNSGAQPALNFCLF